MGDKKKVEHNYYILLPVMSEASVDRVIAVMVKRGYKVAPLSSKGAAYLAGEKNLVTIATLNVWKAIDADEEDPMNVVTEDVKDILKVIDAKFYMLFVSEPVNCRWALGNLKQDDVDSAGPYRTLGKVTN